MTDLEFHDEEFFFMTKNSSFHDAEFFHDGKEVDFPIVHDCQHLVRDICFGWKITDSWLNQNSNTSHGGMAKRKPVKGASSVSPEQARRADQESTSDIN